MSVTIDLSRIGDDPMSQLLRRHQKRIAAACLALPRAELPNALVVIAEWNTVLSVMDLTTRDQFFASESFGLLGTEKMREELRTWPRTKGRLLILGVRMQPGGWGFSELEIQEEEERDGN